MNRFLGVNAVLLAIVLACFGLLGAAMYMQLVLDMLPCPLCVIQRYAFLLTGVFALIALIWRSRLKAILGLGLLASLGGVGTAGYHVWALSQPPGSCGVDPLTGPLNNLFSAQLFPSLFKATGFCDTPYDPILGLSIPAWACVWFCVFAVTQLIVIARFKTERQYFGKTRA